MNRWLVGGVLLGLTALSFVVNGSRYFAPQRLPQPSVEALIAEVVSAPDPAQQLAAATQLLQSRSLPEASVATKASMALAIKDSPHPGVRVAMIQALAEAYDYAAMPTLLDALEDPDPAVAGKAAAAVQHMLGLRYDVATVADQKKISQMARRDWQMLSQSPHLDLWKKTIAKRKQTTAKSGSSR